ncbi:MAG TPA: hypothetical protein VM324_08780 [Egibacteraceae bacterium]|nr:hypothetical protein [Egibacteraceae bacterium]
MPSRWCVAVVLLGLLIPACSSGVDPAEEAETAPDPRAEAVTVEQYATASHEACEYYLGALFSLAQDDEELDLAREDASQKLFLRRAGDIAALYADYRSTIDALEPPDGAEAAHEEIVALMDDNLGTIEAVGESYARGAREEGASLMAESSRIDEEIAALQTGLGIRPCGR